MWSLRLCIMLVAYLWTAAAELRCAHPQCVAGSISAGVKHSFLVEDHKIHIIHEDSGDIAIYCDGWRALESPAMPSFTSLVRLTSLELSFCPPPTAASLADVLAALNVTLLQEDGTFGNLALMKLVPEPPLAARHFTGLERIEGLEIQTETESLPLRPAGGFLATLTSLVSLDLTNVPIPAGELNNPPLTLRSLKLIDTGLEQLPEILLTLPNLEKLEVTSEMTNVSVMFKAPTPTLKTLVLHSTNTMLQLNKFPVVETIDLWKWTERRPAAFTQCDELLTLQLYESAAEELPDRWVAACPRLDVLSLISMHKLTSLPARLLEGAHELTSLYIMYGVLETLPEGLLDDAQNLIDLCLTHNRLKTISSDAFMGPRALYRLALNNNQLQSNSLAALKPLTHLNWLGLSDNSRISDLCDQNGYSPLLQLTQLRTLQLSGTNITRICRDWRENMTLLLDLQLKDTKITELQYTDFQYTRDATIKGAQVRLEGAPIKSVRFTEDDYKRSLTAPATDAWVRLTSRLECDCRMYWTRLVAESARHTFRLMPFLCTGNRKLSDETADNICAPTINAAPFYHLNASRDLVSH